MTEYVSRHGLFVAVPLAALIEEQVLLDIDPDAFWAGYVAQPPGHTEPLLHAARRAAKTA